MYVSESGPSLSWVFLVILFSPSRRILPRLGQDSFLSNPFQIVTHHSSHHLCGVLWATESLANLITNSFDKLNTELKFELYKANGWKSLRTTHWIFVLWFGECYRYPNNIKIKFQNNGCVQLYIIFISIYNRNNCIASNYSGFLWPLQSHIYIYFHIKHSRVCRPGFQVSAVFNFCPVLPAVEFDFHFDLCFTAKYNQSSSLLGASL